MYVETIFETGVPELADASGLADEPGFLKLDEARIWKEIISTGVAPSVLMYRTKYCEMLHAELPLWEAKMEVHRGKAAR